MLVKIAFTVQLRNGFDGWMGVVFHQLMFPADAIIAWYDRASQEFIVWDAYNPGIPTTSNFPSPLQDTDPLIRIVPGSPTDNQNNVTVVEARHEGGVMTVRVERELQTRDILDYQFVLGNTLYLLAQYNAHQIFDDRFGAVRPSYTNQKVFQFTPR